MATTIDWHSHHTAPEISDRIKDLTGKRPHIDALDSPDFSKRIREMDEAGIDVQLICQGAGVYADQLPPDQALDIVRMNVTLLENVEIGEEALIAAGSVVVPHTKIPPRVLAAGAPAKVKKELAGEALHWIKMGSSTYVNLCKSYLGGDFKIIG